MGSKRTGAAVAVIGTALAIVLFVVLSDGGDDGPTVTPVTPPEQETKTGKGSARRDESEQQRPSVPAIVVRRGQPVGGVQELEFPRGEAIRLTVESDVADHVHLHGYDVFEDVPAGGKVSFDVPATIEGVFEVELENRGIPLAEISVTPG